MKNKRGLWIVAFSFALAFQFSAGALAQYKFSTTFDFGHSGYMPGWALYSAALTVPSIAATNTADTSSQFASDGYFIPEGSKMKMIHAKDEMKICIDAANCGFYSYPAPNIYRDFVPGVGGFEYEFTVDLRNAKDYTMSGTATGWKGMKTFGSSLIPNSFQVRLMSAACGSEGSIARSTITALAWSDWEYGTNTFSWVPFRLVSHSQGENPKTSVSPISADGGYPYFPTTHIAGDNALTKEYVRFKMQIIDPTPGDMRDNILRIYYRDPDAARDSEWTLFHEETFENHGSDAFNFFYTIMFFWKFGIGEPDANRYYLIKDLALAYNGQLDPAVPGNTCIGGNISADPQNPHPDSCCAVTETINTIIPANQNNAIWSMDKKGRCTGALIGVNGNTKETIPQICAQVRKADVDGSPWMPDSGLRSDSVTYNTANDTTDYWVSFTNGTQGNDIGQYEMRYSIPGQGDSWCQ